MKRKIYTLIATSLLVFSLTACSNTSRPSSNSKSDSTSQSNKKESSHEVKNITGTKAMQIKIPDGTDGESTVTETIGYDGDDFTSLKIEVLQPLPKQIKDEIGSRSIDEVKGQLIEAMGRLDIVQNLKKVNGTKVDLDVTGDSQMKFVFTFDMKTVDKSALSQASAGRFNLDKLDSTTPMEYILDLAQAGAKPVAVK